jgi:hypothetical protein
MTDQDIPVPQILQQIMQQMTAMQETFNATIVKQGALISELKEEIATIRTRSTPLPEVAATPPNEQPVETINAFGNSSPNANYYPQPRLSDRLPDPSTFTGNRKALPSFLSKLQYKLEGNADRFPTSRLQFLYAYSLIGGDAACIVRPLIDKDIGTLPQLVSFLEATYGDPNRRATAQAKLATLRQGKKSFVSHFVEFRRLASDSELNEAGLIMQLKTSLSNDLRRAMIGIQTPDSLNDYANQIMAYDNDLRFLTQQQFSTPARNKTYRDPNAMDIDAVKHDYAPVGSEERERRKREGRCFKCGSKDHISPACNKPIPRSEIRKASTYTSRPSSRSSTRSTPRQSKHSQHSSYDRTRSSTRSRGRSLKDRSRD